MYGRTVQPAQYENKKAEVEISFAVAEGEDYNPMLNEAIAVAQNKAHEMVGLKVSAAVASQTALKQVAAPTAGGKEAAAAAMNAKDAKSEPAKRGPGRPPKVPAADPESLDDDDAKAHQAKMDANNPAKQAISTGEARVDPAQEDAELWDEAPAATVPDITDKDLADAATKHNARLKHKHEGAAPSMIKALIKTYFPEGAVATLAKLPKDKRADFVTKLEAMT